MLQRIVRGTLDGLSGLLHFTVVAILLGIMVLPFNCLLCLLIFYLARQTEVIDDRPLIVLLGFPLSGLITLAVSSSSSLEAM